jgi:hypothetical protein
LTGHRLSLLASLILLSDQSEPPSRVAELVANRQWTELARFREGDQTADMVQYHVLQCPAHSLALLRFTFTAELWSSDWLDAIIPLRPEESPQVANLVQENEVVL